MKEIYIICRLDADGMEHIMQSAYSTQEYALEALGNLRNEAKMRGDNKSHYYSGNRVIDYIRDNSGNNLHLYTRSIVCG